MNKLKPFLDDMLSMSTGTDGRTLEIHFSRPVTKEDRQAFADAHNAIVRQQLSAQEPTGWEGEVKLTVEQAWTILCETPDITSPEEYPDHALITMEQLRGFMARAVTSAATEVDTCPVCAKPLLDDDTCATDIEMGICHAACLEGSPTVDLETGDEVDGPMETYRYGDTAPTKANGGQKDG